MLASMISSMRLLTDPPFFCGDLDLDLGFDFAFGFAFARGAGSIDDAAVSWCAPKSSSSCERMRSLSDAFTSS